MILDTLRGREAFARLAALDEEIFPLDRAALTIALEEYPRLELEEYVRRLDTFAARAQVLLGTSRAPQDALDAIRDVLFVQEGLHGNTENYYDPRNSFLNEVLDRKAGIPISLSVVFMEVARRLGLALDGVGLPGHFIVKYARAGQDILIDPFNGGRTLSRDDCQELLDKVYSGALELQPGFFTSMDKKAIVSRMLYNLKGIYYQREDFQKALSVVERILLVNPGTPSELRDRGLLYMQTSLFSKALPDLEYYLRHSAAPEDASYIQRHVKTLRTLVACAN